MNKRNGITYVTPPSNSSLYDLAKWYAELREQVRIQFDCSSYLCLPTRSKAEVARTLVHRKGWHGLSHEQRDFCRDALGVDGASEAHYLPHVWGCPRVYEPHN